MVTKDMTGMRFGRWAVIERAGSVKGKATWRCLCDCGNEKVISGDVLRRGLSHSCGCLKTERKGKRSDAVKAKIAQANRKHGMCSSRLYQIWENMKTRCTNEKTTGYLNYGGRGIRVCDEWLHSFEAFRDWALANGYRDDLTIERKDVNGNYCPENCTWATPKEQANNRRSNTAIFYAGKTQTLEEWAKEVGITKQTIWKRLKRGWTIERALSEPTTKRKEDDKK